MDRLAALLQACKPAQVLVRRRAELTSQRARLENALKQQIDRAKQHVTALHRSMLLLGPEQTLQRGYSITRKLTGEIVQRSIDVGPGEEIRTRLAEGELKSRITERA